MTDQMPDPFGDVLPENTRDEERRGCGSDEVHEDDDERLRREVPPHHN